jgi:hypothetical protein
MSTTVAPERLRVPSRTVRVAVLVASSPSPGGLRRLLVGLRHPHVEVVVVTREDGLCLRRAAGRDATVVSLPEPGTASMAAAVRAGAAASTAPVVVVLRDAVLITAEAALRLAEGVAGGSAVVIPGRTEMEGAPAVAGNPAVVATRRALLAGLTDRPNGAAGIDWCDDLVAGPGRVERRSDVGYLGLGRAEPDVTGCGAARRR